MEAKILRALSDKVYERRKAGALELEQLIRAKIIANDWHIIDKIVSQLCHDFAYATHQPYARNGGLIGLAAASIALGPDVIRYLKQIVPPVLACFGDQDARVRYYACESMYNIAKTSKGETLPYFNEIFDALSKLAADSEMSVKNGAELLDRLLKDIISDSATSYVSVIHHKDDSDQLNDSEPDLPAHRSAAFSLPRLIPLLEERIMVINAFTRMFLVQWITLLDSIPDLEVVTYLPAFLGGLFRFLNDPQQDLVTATEHILERFLSEIKQVAKVKEDLIERRRERFENATNSSALGNPSDTASVDANFDEDIREAANGEGQRSANEDEPKNESAVLEEVESSDDDAASNITRGEWIPGQDVEVDHPKILGILVDVLREIPEEHIQLTALRWIDSFFDICPSDILGFAPSLLNQVLPALSSSVSQVRQAGVKVNSALMEYVLLLPDDTTDRENGNKAIKQIPSPSAQKSLERPPEDVDQTDPTSAGKAALAMTQSPLNIVTDDGCCQEPSLDYEGCVNSLTLQFLNEHEATRVATFSWLIMLQQKAPRRVLAAHDGTFPALLKTLSDPSDTVVTRDLQLLSQICQGSDDAFFTFFMVNLLKLFSTDRRLLENRGNMIIRQLCTSLSAERIYRTMADCLEKDEDADFTSTMVLYLNNNLITAPQLEDLRKKLRHWESKGGQTLFVALFKAWCPNAVATISLCLLAQAYEHAYNIIQVFADVEITLSTLIQLDKLINLLEAPVFTFLRLQLLEPSLYPYLYKTLYGLLMLLPQSAAFGYLKNRLNSVSPLGYLSMTQPPNSRSATPGAAGQSAGAPAFERAGRLKPTAARDESAAVRVPWNELLERYKILQEKARRVRQGGVFTADRNEEVQDGQRKALPAARGATGSRPTSAGDNVTGPAGSRIPAIGGRWEQSHGQAGAQSSGAGQAGTAGSALSGKEAKEIGHRSRFSASNLGRSFVSHAKNAGSGIGGSASKGKDRERK